jgi:TatA/E family protein of Tat protein translocase
MGTLGVQEMVVIFLLALVLFGPKKLPELGRTIGKALTEFRRASSDLKATFEREMQSLERENESLKEVTHNVVKDIYKPSFDYGYNDQHDVTASHHDSNHESAATENPSTVGASAVPGAESQGSTETATAVAVVTQAQAHPPVEGTVPRSGDPETPQHS